MLLLPRFKKIMKLLPFFSHSGPNKVHISLASLGEIKKLLGEYFAAPCPRENNRGYSLRGRKVLEIVPKFLKTANFCHFLSFFKNSGNTLSHCQSTERVE